MSKISTMTRGRCIIAEREIAENYYREVVDILSLQFLLLATECIKDG